MNDARKLTMEFMFGAVFVGFGFPAFVFGLLLNDYTEIIGGLALSLIGFGLIQLQARAES